jgi:hypothetical protein
LTIALSFFRQGEDADTIPFSDVLEQARSGNVERIEASDRRLKVSLVGRDADVNSRIGRDVDLVQTLSDQGVKVGGIGGVELRYKSPSPIGNWIGLVFNFIPLIAFAIIYYTVRNAVREGMRQGRREE